MTKHHSRRIYMFLFLFIFLVVSCTTPVVNTTNEPIKPFIKLEKALNISNEIPVQIGNEKFFLKPQDDNFKPNKNTFGVKALTAINLIPKDTSLGTNVFLNGSTTPNMSFRFDISGVFSDPNDLGGGYVDVQIVGPKNSLCGTHVRSGIALLPNYGSYNTVIVGPLTPSMFPNGNYTLIVSSGTVQASLDVTIDNKQALTITATPDLFSPKNNQTTTFNVTSISGDEWNINLSGNGSNFDLVSCIPNSNAITWNGRDSNGVILPNGAYKAKVSLKNYPTVFNETTVNIDGTSTSSPSPSASPSSTVIPTPYPSPSSSAHPAPGGGGSANGGGGGGNSPKDPIYPKPKDKPENCPGTNFTVAGVYDNDSGSDKPNITIVLRPNAPNSHNIIYSNSSSTEEDRIKNLPNNIIVHDSALPPTSANNLIITAETPLKDADRDLAHDSITDIVQIPLNMNNGEYPTYKEVVQNTFTNKPHEAKILTDLDKNTVNIATNIGGMKLPTNNKLKYFVDKSGKVKNAFVNCCVDNKLGEDEASVSTVRLPTLGVNLQKISENMKIGDSKKIAITIKKQGNVETDNINMTLTKKASNNGGSIWDIKCGG